MINFIHKLKHLPEKYMMNSVLENFTILQVHKHTQMHILNIIYIIHTIRIQIFLDRDSWTSRETDTQWWQK
jgi:hypothetical protein